MTCFTNSELIHIPFIQPEFSYSRVLTKRVCPLCVPPHAVICKKTNLYFVVYILSGMRFNEKKCT